MVVKETEPAAIHVDDIVTVRHEEFVYTHRVVEKLEGETSLFELKGDANEDPDPGFIEASQIIGTVILVLPLSHLYTPYGFICLLMIPATVFIGKQMYTIYQFTKRRNKKETMRFRRESRRSPTLGTNTLLLALIVTLSTTQIIAPHFYGGSHSYVSDTERVMGIFHAGIWEVDAYVEIEPDIDPDTFNLDSQGEWVVAYIETEYDEEDIDVETVMLDGVIQAELGEVQEGCLMVKFDRASLIEYLVGEGYGDGDRISLTVTGEFTDGVRFTGEDTIAILLKEQSGNDSGSDGG